VDLDRRCAWTESEESRIGFLSAVIFYARYPATNFAEVNLVVGAGDKTA